MTEENTPDGRKDVRFRQDMLWLSTLGINLVFASAAGVVIGHYFDKLFKTSPVFTILFFCIGTLAGFRQIYKQVQKLGEDGNKKNDPRK
jgi:ATP synthase protein I